MKVMVLLLALVLVCQTFAIDDMDSRTNLWYGSDIGRAPIDDMLEELNSKPMSMSMQEYRAIQATNQTPVLADVIASNIAHAVEMGQSTNGVTWRGADEIRIRIPPPPEPREDWSHQRSRHLMMLMGVPPGDESAVCTNWFRPTNICLNGTSYAVNHNGENSFEIYLASNVQQRVAYGWCYTFNNGKAARVEGFLTYLQAVHQGQIEAAMGLSVHNIDAATNMMFLCSQNGFPRTCEVLIYKNIVLRICAPTNVVAFAAEIINAGLPESERIEVTQ